MIPKPPGEGNWMVCLVTPGKDDARGVKRFRDPHEEKSLCGQLNAGLAKDRPASAARPVDFYFVHSVNGSSVPWLAALDRDELPPEMSLHPVCLECGSVRLNRRGLCRTCYLDLEIRAKYPKKFNERRMRMKNPTVPADSKFGAGVFDEPENTNEDNIDRDQPCGDGDDTGEYDGPNRPDDKDQDFAR